MPTLVHDGKVVTESTVINEYLDDAFPEADAALLVEETVELPVQVNGKVRAVVETVADADEATALAAALAEPNVQAHVGDATSRKVIYVPGRMLNLVV